VSSLFSPATKEALREFTPNYFEMPFHMVTYFPDTLHYGRKDSSAADDPPYPTYTPDHNSPLDASHGNNYPTLLLGEA
jgi:hypothetical protein